MKREVKEIKNAFDKDNVTSDGRLYCNKHRVFYKAIETGNVCLKFYKNCPYCEAETNYRIAMKEHLDTIDYNRWATSSNQCRARIGKARKSLSALIDEVTQNDEIDYPF